MKVKKSSGAFLKAKDAKPRSKVKFLDEGEWQESQNFKYEDGRPIIQLVFKVMYEGEEMLLKVNKASRVAMIEAFGDETKNWVGKEASIFILPTPNGKEKMIVLEPIVDGEPAKGWDE